MIFIEMIVGDPSSIGSREITLTFYLYNIEIIFIFKLIILRRKKKKKKEEF